MTRKGSNARKQAARELAAAEGIPYTEALRRQSTEDIAEPRTVPPVPNHAPAATLIGHTGPVKSVAFHPGGHAFVTGGDATVRWWDLATEETTTVLDHDAIVFSVDFAPDGNTVAAAGRDGRISLWRPETGEVDTLTRCAGDVHALRFSPDGSTVATNEAPPRRGFDLPPEGGAIVHVWDLATGQAAATFADRGAYAGHALAFHPGGDLLATSGGLDGTVALHYLRTGESMALTGHSAGVNAIAFSPDGATVATASVDTTVRVWDLATRRTLAIFKPHGHYAQAVAFAPDGLTLASSSTDPVVRLWDLEEERAKAILFGHTDYITSLAFSPDGRTLVSAGTDRTIRLWAVPAN